MKSLLYTAKSMEKVTVIVPVKDEEVGLNFLLDDYNGSPLKEIYDIRFIFVIDVRTSDSSKKIALTTQNLEKHTVKLFRIIENIPFLLFLWIVQSQKHRRHGRRLWRIQR